MKYHTTKQAVNNGYYYKICIGYCDLQSLLSYENPVAYTSGVYGWNCDIYDCFPELPWNIAIITGYRPFGNIHANYDRNKKYEKKADSIRNDYSLPFEKRKAKIHKLLVKLVSEYVNEYRAKQEGK